MSRQTNIQLVLFSSFNRGSFTYRHLAMSGQTNIQLLLFSSFKLICSFTYRHLAMSSQTNIQLLLFSSFSRFAALHKDSWLCLAKQTYNCSCFQLLTDSQLYFCVLTSSFTYKHLAMSSQTNIQLCMFSCFNQFAALHKDIWLNLAKQTCFCSCFIILPFRSFTYRHLACLAKQTYNCSCFRLLSVSQLYI